MRCLGKLTFLVQGVGMHDVVEHTSLAGWSNYIEREKGRGDQNSPVDLSQLIKGEEATWFTRRKVRLHSVYHTNFRS